MTRFGVAITAEGAVGWDLPLAGQKLAKTDFTDSYDSERTVVVGVEEANLITSMVEADATHKPVVDIDLPVTVLPSATPGHFHLFVDKAMEWPVYCRLLKAMVGAGLVEDGYYQAALRRGYTAVRLPWVRKEAPEFKPTDAELLKHGDLAMVVTGEVQEPVLAEYRDWSCDPRDADEDCDADCCRYWAFFGTEYLAKASKVTVVQRVKVVPA